MGLVNSELRDTVSGSVVYSYSEWGAQKREEWQNTAGARSVNLEMKHVGLSIRLRMGKTIYIYQSVLRTSGGRGCTKSV